MKALRALQLIVYVLLTGGQTWSGSLTVNVAFLSDIEL